MLTVVCLCLLMVYGASASDIARDHISYTRPGDYIDGVARGPFECNADVALVVDISSSIGVDAAKLKTLHFIGLLLSTLDRLPSVQGSDTFFANIFLTLFNGDVKTLGLDSFLQSHNKIRGDLFKALLVLNTSKGGTAITKAIEDATEAIVEGERDSSVPKYMITITDGKEDDYKKLATLPNPAAAAQLASEEHEIYQLAVGLEGQSGKYDELIITSIGIDGNYKVESNADFNAVATQIVDFIAAGACYKI